jgi:hypothetical protein
MVTGAFYTGCASTKTLLQPYQCRRTPAANHIYRFLDVRTFADASKLTLLSLLDSE